LQELARRGGTSIAAALGMVVLLVVAFLVVMIPVQLLLYPE
jgi:hypothetical protein